MSEKIGFWAAISNIFGDPIVWGMMFLMVFFIAANMSDIVAAYRAPTKLDQRVKVLEEKVKRLEREKAGAKVAPPKKSVY